MRVLLVDADSQKGFPNLALMKLSAYYRAKGDQTELIRGIPAGPPLGDYDRAYISCIFFQNIQRVREYAANLSCPVEIGGSGGDMMLVLPDEIEHIRPDYSLYGVGFSLGFTSRGCIRKCGFCIVSEKEGYIHNNAPISEFHNPTHKKLVLLDNNFLASPRWRENLSYIQEHDLKVNFNQGLDIRLLNDESAGLLRGTKCYDWQFKKKKISFAFDSPSYEREVLAGIACLKRAGFSEHQLRDNIMFYILVGYNTTPEEDLSRVRLLIDNGIGPYIMRYNQNAGPNRILLHLARWVNRKLYQHMDFCDYDYSDSLASYRATFRGSPDPSWPGRGCPQGGYAWANRQYEEEQQEKSNNDTEQEEL